MFNIEMFLDFRTGFDEVDDDYQIYLDGDDTWDRHQERRAYNIHKIWSKTKYGVENREEKSN